MDVASQSSAQPITGNGSQTPADKAEKLPDLVIRIPHDPKIPYAAWLKLTAKITGYVARELEKIG